MQNEWKFLEKQTLNKVTCTTNEMLIKSSILQEPRPRKGVGYLSIFPDHDCAKVQTNVELKNFETSIRKPAGQLPS
jgi:hypothetical protein